MRCILSIFVFWFLFGSVSGCRSGEASTIPSTGRTEASIAKKHPRTFRCSLMNLQWLDQGRHLGYRVETAPGLWEYWLVDASTGEKRRLADSVALQEAWKRLGSGVAGGAAPAADQDVVFDPGGSFSLNSSGRWWRYQPQPAPSLAAVPAPYESVAASPEMTATSDYRYSPNSPDGRFQVSFKGGNLWLREMARNEAAALTTDGQEGAAYEWPCCWSGDSRYLLVYKIKRPAVRQIAIVESSPKDQLQPRLHWIRYAKPGDPLPEYQPWLFDLATRQGKPVDIAALCPNPWSLSSPQWNQGLGRFTCIYNQRGHQVMRLVGIDPAGGQASCLLEESSPTYIGYSQKFYGRFLPGSELLWMSERSGWNHLWLHDLKANRATPVTSGAWTVDKVLHVDEASRQLWFWGCGFVPGENPYDRQLFRVNFDGTGLLRLTDGPGSHDFAMFSPNFRTLLVRWSRPDQPPVHELRDGQTGRLICRLETGDASTLAAAGRQLPEPFSAKGRDGQTDIWGVIFRPAGFDPARRYPVVESIYAGPHGHFAPVNFAANPREQELADRGFIVVQIDGMGTSGRSKAFQDVSWQNLQDAGFPDRKLWIQAAARQYPQMDLDRVGIFGGSAGGQNAMRAVLDHYPFYKVAVADCGCHDNRMDKIWWNEQFLGWPVGAQYEKSSNVVDAHRLQGKLFLIVGEMDTNVDPASTMQVANALVQAKKPFDLLVIPGGGHCSGQATPYGWRRIQDYFLKNL